MNDRVASLWVYLSATPLLHLTLTICIFVLARLLYRVTSTGRCNTLLISKEGVLRNVEKTIP